MKLATNPDEVRENTRTSISVGKYTVIGPGATLHPPHRVFRARTNPAEGKADGAGEVSYYPMKLGENVYIGANAYVEAASVGSHVFIGKGAVIGNGCIVKDGVKVLEGSIMVAGMVAPSGTVVGGRPARVIEELPDGWGLGGAGGGTLEGEEGRWVEGGELRELVRGFK